MNTQVNDKNKNFVIRIEQGGQPTVYYAVDPQTGYPWYPDSFWHAEIFRDRPAAEKVLDYLIEQGPKVTVGSDGTRYPVHEISAALQLCNAHPQGTATFQICKINLEMQIHTTISGKIEKPISHRYSSDTCN